MTRLVRIAAKATGARDPNSWKAEMAEVWQKTPDEVSKNRKSVAETDKIYIDTQVLLPEEVAIKRFGGGEFDETAPQIDVESRESLIEADLQRAKEGPPPLELAEPQVIMPVGEQEEEMEEREEDEEQ